MYINCLLCPNEYYFASCLSTDGESCVVVGESGFLQADSAEKHGVRVQRKWYVRH